MKFVIYKDEEGNFVGVEVGVKFDGEFVDEVEVEGWDEFKKYMVVVYGYVNSYVIRDGEKEFLYDVVPDVVAEFKIQVPIWKFGEDKWAINVCGDQILTFKVRVPSMSSTGSFYIRAADIDDLVSSQLFDAMIIEALKKNRFGEIVGNVEIKYVGGENGEV